MDIEYSPKFFRLYRKLPKDIRSIAEDKSDIFVENPFDRRLKTHKLTGDLDGYWAFWIDYKNRIIFSFSGKNKVTFHSVGDHSIYR